MKQGVIFPGSFDPVTRGHLDIIARACSVFDRVIVSVLNNSEKKTLFSIEERLIFLKLCTKHLKGLEIDHYNGLLIHYAKFKKVKTIIRGLRTINDLEHELVMAKINKDLSKNSIETIFFTASTKYQHISSRLVKEILKLNGNIKTIVPKEIFDTIKKQLTKCSIDTY